MAILPNLVAARRLILATAVAFPLIALAALVFTSATSRLASAAFPGVNGKIAFSTNRDGNSEIYVMEPDGTNQTRLTNATGTDMYPHWSPDGSKIAFDSSRDGGPEIYVMNADGSGQTQLTNSPGESRQARWSPDGTKIAFASNRTGVWQIYVMNADGSAQTQLVGAGDNWGPSWSPDGAKIAFGTSRAGNYDVYVMNTDGNGQTVLAGGTGNQSAPNWSPGGTRLAYMTSSGISVMNADGSDQFSLTSTSDAFPAWSPDGTRIAFQSTRGGSTDIYVMNADGSAQTAIGATGATEAMADWQPVCLAEGCPTPVPVPSPTPCPKEGCPSPTKPPPGPTGTPTPQPEWMLPDFSIRINDSTGAPLCDSSGTPTVSCQLPAGAPFTLDVYLNALPAALPAAGYAGFDTHVLYQGVARAPGGADPERWPDCTYDGMNEQAGSIAAGCAINVQTQSPSNYTGVMLSYGFVCTASGAITLDTADVVDAQILKYVQNADESLSVSCTAVTQASGFSIRVGYTSAAARCDSSGKPSALCELPIGVPFVVDVYLNELPADLPSGRYSGFDSAVQYDGVTRTPDLATIRWPDCVFDGHYDAAGLSAAGCAIGIGQPSSQYTGLMVTYGFVCTASGSVALTMGDVVDANFQMHAPEVLPALSIVCADPAPFPGDSDTDQCPDTNEIKLDPREGGQRDFLNPWDFFNPEKGAPVGGQTIADVLKVVLQYNKNVGHPAYTIDTDRTGIAGGYPWSLGPPDGLQSVTDVLAAVKQFNHNCP